MKRLILVVNVLFLISCAQQQEEQKVDLKAEGEKVMQLSKEWSQAASAGDVEKIVSFWAEDAVLMSAGQPVLEGKPAIRKMVEESYKFPGFKISWQPQKVVVSESGDMAYIIEKTQVSLTDSTGKPFIIDNNAVSIWRKQADGTWKNAVDIATPESAPAN